MRCCVIVSVTCIFTEPRSIWLKSRAALETCAVFNASHVRDFIQMTGDSNPIHTSSTAAEAQGMQTHPTAPRSLVYMRFYFYSTPAL